MLWDTHAAGVSDVLTDALDYASVSEAITQHVSRSSCQLIERVAHEVAQIVLTQFAVEKVTVKVSKPGAVKNANNVAVKISRARN